MNESKYQGIIVVLILAVLALGWWCYQSEKGEDNLKYIGYCEGYQQAISDVYKTDFADSFLDCYGDNDGEPLSDDQITDVSSVIEMMISSRCEELSRDNQVPNVEPPEYQPDN